MIKRLTFLHNCARINFTLLFSSEHPSQPPKGVWNPPIQGNDEREEYLIGGTLGWVLEGGTWVKMEVQGEEVKERSFMPGVSTAQISRRNNVKGNCSCSPGEPCTQEAEMRCSGGLGGRHSEDWQAWRLHLTSDSYQLWTIYHLPEPWPCHVLYKMDIYCGWIRWKPKQCIKCKATEYNRWSTDVNPFTLPFTCLVYQISSPTDHGCSCWQSPRVQHY